ncbi:SHD1 domain-containing protein [Botrimarina hoheduenensis]|uniref:SLA1 homology domain-containing protein n=1 Tax=Botrimarina hoheduenensis TaxID=2528000 RepID=A0A5C5WEH3_9BACT|nr:SHD1 domain-containing protein [Botrimarina hoheduenensis]TWT48553.1 hypothetical protein Pla111_03260 [Botrimarina hoheduenensis]
MKKLELLRRTLACVLSLLLAIDVATACRWCAQEIVSSAVSSNCSNQDLGFGPAAVLCPSEISACCLPVVSNCCSACGSVFTTHSSLAPCESCGCGASTPTSIPVEQHAPLAPTPVPSDAGRAPQPTPVAPAPFSDRGFSSTPLIDETPQPNQPRVAPPEGDEAVVGNEPDIFDMKRPIDNDDAFAQEPATESLTPPPASDGDIAEDLAPPVDDAFDAAAGDNNLFDAPSDVESAFDEAPTAEDPTPFDAPAEPQPEEALTPVDEAEQDLFDVGNTNDSVPAQDGFDGADAFEQPPTPAEEVPANEADAFSFEGSDSAETVPADDTALPDAEEDLFGVPEEGADAPANEEQDVFGDESFSEDLPPAEAPETTPGEEAFGDGDAFGTDDAFGSDQGFEQGEFGEATEEPAGEEAPFDEAPEEAPFEEAVPAEPSNEEAAEDLFGDFGMILREPGGYDSDRPRTWIDNSGQFSCQGRLIAVDGQTVRLEKPSGGVSRVPIGRLSNSDLEFVTRQVAAEYDLRALLGGSEVRTAAR